MTNGVVDAGGDAVRVRPVRRRRLSATNPHEAHEQLRSVYGPTSVHLVGDTDDFGFSLDVATVDDLGIGTVRYSASAVAEPAPPHPLVVITAHRSWRLSLEIGTDVVEGSPLLLPRDQPFRAHWHGLDATVVALDPAAVARTGAELTGIAPEHVRFTGTTAISSERARYWAACATHIRRDVLDDDVLAAQPLVRDHAVRHMAVALLATFPNTAGAFDAPGRRDDAAPATVRRAIDFIDAHAHEAIGLVEIAAAARLGPRGLQQAFAHHHDTTPLAHLRRVRLEHAHRDLRAGDPTEGDTVAGIAARWGFAHAGRFSLTYREHFGVSPSQTLRD